MRRSPASAGGSWANGGTTALAYDELAGLSGLGEPVAVDEVSDVYVPLARLLALRVEAARELSAAQNAFLGETHKVPFLVALGGSVAVGKSTAARLIVRLLASPAPGLARRARHHGRLPAAQRDPDRARHPRPQGLPGVL